jgi:phosphotriesterase-related protein
MAKVNGVLGPIDTADLGFTLMHEHILVCNWTPRMALTGWIDLEEHRRFAVGEVKAALERGVGTIVDLTPLNLGRDIHVIRAVAEEAQAQVIAATGLYWNDELWLQGWEADRLVELLLPDIEKGIQGTDSKAGIIKAATDAPGVTPANQKTLQVAARLHRATGVPISTHTSAQHETGVAQQDVFEAEGVDLGRVVIGHCGDSEDVDYLERVLRRGSFIGMDRFGLDMILPTEKRVSTIAKLCERGWADRLVLSHDACCHIDWFPPEIPRPPRWNFRHIPDDVVPALRKEGVSEERIALMTAGNPRRVFEAQGGY